jgi:hypothetical protein
VSKIAKKINTKKGAKPTAKGAKTLLSHWVEDVSLEVSGPAQSYKPGEREVGFTVKILSTPIPQEGLIKLQLCLQANIIYQKLPISIAELRYSCVAEISQFEKSPQKIIDQAYPYAKICLEKVLHLAGHTPPLPDNLNNVSN